MNILFITIDALRFDRLKAYSGTGDPSTDSGQALTPALDQLAERGVVFHAAYTVANFTDPSHISMFTAQYPSSHGVIDNGVVFDGSEHTTLADVLTQNGYRTVGIVSVDHLSSPFGLDKGFQDYHNTPLAGLYYNAKRSRYTVVALQFIWELFPRLNTHWRPAEKTTDIALRWFRKHRERPFFMWIHYFDPHIEWREWDGYNRMVQRVDQQVGRLVSYLTSRNEETLIVITADHGTGIGSYPVRHAYSIKDDVLKVPLIFAWIPARSQQVRVTSQVRTIDIAPTLLSLLNIPIPDEWQGASLTSHLQGEEQPDLDVLFWGYPRYCNCIGIRTPDWKMAVYGPPTKYSTKTGEELYGLDNDPQETTNVIDHHPEVAAELRTKLLPHLRDGFPDYVEPEDPRVVELLRSLGYLD